MTNIANKHGLRAAAKERTNRHAQRTPLPPREGQVAVAREVLAVVAEHSRKAKDLDETAGDAKSWAKVRAFQERAVAAKWDTSLGRRGEAVELTATRGPETIVQAWRDGVWQYDASVYAFADRTTKPRNASGAVKLLGRPVSEAEDENAKVNANNAFRRREPKSLATIVLPLDPDLLTDEEAAKYFRGRTVRWYNRIARGAETATVSRQSVVRVTRYEGEVTVSFCCPVTGFRAFHLSAVLAVGKGRLASAETREIMLGQEDVA